MSSFGTKEIGSWNNDVDWLDFGEKVPHMADIHVDQFLGSLQGTEAPIHDRGNSYCFRGEAKTRGPLICTLTNLKNGKPCNKMYLSVKNWRRHVQTVHTKKVRRLYKCTLYQEAKDVQQD